MLRLLIDENFDHRILRGLKTRLPEADFVVVQQIGLAGFKDLALLRWATENDRAVLTHDVSTMAPDAEHLLLRGEPMSGVIVVPDKMPIGRAIEDLELVIAAIRRRNSEIELSTCHSNVHTCSLLFDLLILLTNL